MWQPWSATQRCAGGMIGDAVRALTKDEIKVMDKILRDALNQGAMGLSMGLIYAHEVNSSLEELKSMVNALKPSNKYLSVHLRSEAGHILEALDEVLGLAGEAGVPVKISHLKIRGKKNWHLFENVLNKLEAALHQGIKVSFDVYPYDTSWSVLYTYLPKWAYEGGRKQIVEAIKDPVSRRKILDHLRQAGDALESIVVAGALGNNNFTGKTLRQIAQNQNVSAEEAVLNVIAATNAQVTVFDHNLSAEQMERLCFSPLSLIATDGAGYSEKNSSLNHPRCYGTFPKFLSMVREKKVLKWEQAIQKLTSEPAKLMGISDRGSFAKNSKADIVIFDPLTLADNADYKNPDLFSDGIDMVVVNGKLGFGRKLALNLYGQVIRR